MGKKKYYPASYNAPEAAEQRKKARVTQTRQTREYRKALKEHESKSKAVKPIDLNADSIEFLRDPFYDSRPQNDESKSLKSTNSKSDSKEEGGWRLKKAEEIKRQKEEDQIRREAEIEEKKLKRAKNVKIRMRQKMHLSQRNEKGQLKIGHFSHVMLEKLTKRRRQEQ